MKKILFSTFLMICTVVAFGQKYETFGKKISAKGAVPVSTLEGKSEFNSDVVKVEGEVESVCQMKGCWMRIKKTDGTTMMVKFKDYDFFVPKDIAGKKVIFEGVPSVKTVSVAEQRHYAEDAKKSKEEIEKITEDKVNLTFLAEGVLVPKN
ncbi:MAG: DUF4920 domain-containing protein [Leadbetterella sp.]|nr:DUF4920 domain-containing protein [Leadbetterella sp.]